MNKQTENKHYVPTCEHCDLEHWPTDVCPLKVVSAVLFGSYFGAYPHERKWIQDNLLDLDKEIFDAAIDVVIKRLKFEEFTNAKPWPGNSE